MITFRAVDKRFADGTVAVHDLDLVIQTGELTVLVGPSGCGKTTTLRMINRLDEPSRGRVEIDGADVGSIQASALRRGIGYVMQHSGLFPHRTVAANIATVPRLLKWDKKRTQRRVDELIERVGLDAALATRYPHQLSGGQQQRVGLARALAADPPIMLMDEPFAAVDPIVRARLQDEFLALQKRLRKTVVFVTHDIDEAIKLGDRIAILGDGGRLAQYARPEALLAAPADAFVADFLGAERDLKRLALIQVAAVDLDRGPVVAASDSVGHALAVAERHASDWLVVLDADGRALGWADAGRLRAAGPRVADSRCRALGASVSPADTLRAALNAIVTSPIGVVPCVDARGAYAGVLDRAALNRHLAWV